MIDFKKIFLDISRIFYPTGRAFRVFTSSVTEQLHKGLALGEERLYKDALSPLDSILPDNDSFDEDDATSWERRLAILSSPGTSFADRKAAILRKIQHPGVTPSRQHFLYLEGELQKAGFDVFVFENRFPLGGGIYETKTADEVAGGAAAGQAGYSSDVQHGQIQHGGDFS